MRYFHGIVHSVSAEGSVRGSAGVPRSQEIYMHRLVPRLWFLGQTIDCRVYQNMSAGDILQADVPGCRPDRSISGPPSSTQREYTVQFNETDLHFATRLMEEEG